MDDQSEEQLLLLLQLPPLLLPPPPPMVGVGVGGASAYAKGTPVMREAFSLDWLPVQTFPRPKKKDARMRHRVSPRSVAIRISLLKKLIIRNADAALISVASQDSHASALV